MEGVHAREMINFLVGCHFGQEVGRDGTVIPFEVPISAIVIEQFPAHFLSDPLNHIVLSVGDIKINGPTIFIFCLLLIAIYMDLRELS